MFDRVFEEIAENLFQRRAGGLKCRHVAVQRERELSLSDDHFEEFAEQLAAVHRGDGLLRLSGAGIFQQTGDQGIHPVGHAVHEFQVFGGGLVDFGAQVFDDPTDDFLKTA